LSFKTHIDVLSSESADMQLPLKPQQIRRCASLVDQLARKLPKSLEWKAAMGKRPSHWAIQFCDDQQMRTFQRSYRKIDRTTDVLSFPSIERKELRPIFASLPPPLRSLGDVVVSIPAVRRGAKRGKRSDRLELLEVLIHAYLHLLGFDHVVGSGITRSEAAEMRRIQLEFYEQIRRQMRLRD